MANARQDLARDVGLLVLRIGIGLLFIKHGWPKLEGGPDKWAKLGTAMEVLGIGFWPTLWGFMAAFAEAVGGVLLALGLAFRPAAALMAFTMLVATLRGIDSGGGWSHPAELGIVFASLLLIGPGSLALDEKFRRG